MSLRQTNIVLIGMPGSGKSTLGRRIAQQRGVGFIDTDVLIERSENMDIQAIINRRGIGYLHRLESEVLNGIRTQHHVIATGGSAVYSATAMQHFGRMGWRVYLKISLSTLLRRVNNVNSRGLAKMPQHSLPRLYKERLPLYEQAADVTFANDLPMTSVRLEAFNQAILGLSIGSIK